METSYAEMTEIAYGPNANVYEDVLRVRPDATEEEIQSAFMDRRFELYEALQDASMLASRSMKTKNGAVLTVSERHFIEKQMDALIACFRMLSDPVRRGEYDSTLRTEPPMSSIYDSPDDVADPSVFADRSNRFKNLSLKTPPRKGIRPTSPNSSSLTKELFPEKENTTTSFITPTKGRDELMYPSSPQEMRQQQHSSPKNNMRLQVPGGNLFDSLSNEESLSSPALSRDEIIVVANKSTSNIENDETNNKIRNSSSSMISADTRGTGVSSLTSKGIHHRKVKWSEDVVVVDDKEEDYDSGRYKYPIADDELEQGVEGASCLGINACDKGNSAISTYLRSNGYDNQAGIIEAVNDEINGAMADTVLAFSQVFSAFTIDDDDIDAFVGTIDSAADDLNYIY